MRTWPAVDSEAFEMRRGAAIAVVERVALGDDQHQRGGRVEGIGDGRECVEPAQEGPFEQVGLDELVGAEVVVDVLEQAGSHVGSRGHDDAVDVTQLLEELFAGPRSVRAHHRIDGDAVGGLYIGDVCGPRRSDFAVDGDADGLLHIELGSLDEVREEGLEERQPLPSTAFRVARGGCGVE